MKSSPTVRSAVRSWAILMRNASKSSRTTGLTRQSARVSEAVTEAGADPTMSLCPVCLKRIEASRVSEGDETFLVKECADHGLFRTVIWRGAPSFSDWRRPKEPVHPAVCYGKVDAGCPFDCGLCEAHEQLPCSVLIEVTDRCNLGCAVCFADAGRGRGDDPSLDAISGRLEREPWPP